MKVLVVDSSETSLQSLLANLKKRGHDVVASKDPCQCVELFQIEKPDLLILEIMMEPIDGYQCAQSVREINKKAEDWVPIIFVSPLLDEASISKGIAAGGDLYLSEPINEKMLQAEINAIEKITAIRTCSALTTQKLRQANQRLNLLTLTDGLTGVLNRRAFDSNFNREWKRASRLGEQYSLISLLMIDIDHFKKYNDTFGHQQGDICLQKIANVLQNLLPRENDELFRYGGEEFIVLLPMADEVNAIKIAERLRYGVEALDISTTISIGVTTLAVKHWSNKEKFLQAADQALYIAKSTGRNQVVFRAAL